MAVHHQLRNRPRVFVTQEPRPNRQGWTPNLQPAEKFGTLVNVFDQNEMPSFGPDSAVFKAAEILDTFDPQRDFLLSPANAGDPAAFFTCALILSRKAKINQIRLLVWDRSRNKNNAAGQYRVVQYNMPSYDA